MNYLLRKNAKKILFTHRIKSFIKIFGFVFSKISTSELKYNKEILFILTIIISLLSFIHFYQSQQTLADYDAIARLNIARKMLDSITPGIGQLGGIWLPFPQILMLPFILNNFLWHSGIAGSIISMSSFIIGSIFLYKTAFLVTKNRYSSFLVWFIFISNINILLLQTMALSESFFLGSMIMVVYFLTQWAIKRDLFNLIFTGFFLIIITLTRYEGYFIFLGTFISVLVLSFLSYLKDHNRKKLEGTVILFGTIASYGIVLWCIYCALFYKDPLYWLHLYAGPKGQIITTTESNALGYHIHITKSLLSSFSAYSEAMLWMNGIFNTLLAAIGFLLLIIASIYGIMRKRIYTYSILLPLSIIGMVLYIFLIYGYQKDLIPDIEYPLITLTSIFNKSFNNVSHSNIRYGIVMAPLIALYIGYFASKKKIFAMLATFIIVFQLYTNVFTPLFLFFQLPKAWYYTHTQGISWFNKKYDKGLILISANRHENFMFQTGLPYKNFIYEGSRNYWLTSLNNPAKYAVWVIYDQHVKEDSVTRFLTINAHKQLETEYQLVYNSDGFKIYRLKRADNSQTISNAKNILSNKYK